MAKKDKKFIEQASAKLELLEEKIAELGSKALEQKERADNAEKELANLKKTKSLSKTSVKSDIKPVAMPTKIDTDTKDKFNTTPKNSAFKGGFKSFRMFSKGATGNLLKSKLFWIMLIVLPLIFTTLEYLVFYDLVASGYDFGGAPWLDDEYLAQTMTALSADLVNWFMVMPLLLLTLIVFPTHIILSRENNMLKRYTLAGMSRKQIYYNYMLFSTIVLLLYILLFVGGWMSVLYRIGNTITYRSPDSEWYTPWYMFSFINFKQLVIIFIFMTFGMNSIGFRKSMKAASAKSVMGWGIGMWIFVSIVQMSSSLMYVNIYHMSGLFGKPMFIEDSIMGNYLIMLLFYALKFMAFFTWPTIMVMGLVASSGAFESVAGNWIFYGVKNPELVTYALELLTISASLWLTLSVFVKKNKIVSYEASR